MRPLYGVADDGGPAMTGNDRTIALINTKGGVGKTTSVANIAGQLAGTYRVLAVDLDPQGHLGIALGYGDTDKDDAGMRILEAIQENEPLAPPLMNVRPNLDVYPGGARLVRLPGIELSGEVLQGVVQAFAEKLAVAAADYDLVLIDCPPGERLIQQMALAAARYVAVPIDTGVGSTQAVKKVLAPLVTRARRDNPELVYLGAFICRQPTSASRILRNTRLRLSEFEEFVPVFETVIRDAPKTVQDAEQAGRLVHEMAGDLGENNKAYFEALRNPNRSTELQDLNRISATSSDLAMDYRELAKEMLQRIASHEQTTPIRKARG